MAFVKYFSKICRGNSNFHQNVNIITDILHRDQHSFLIISRSFLLRMTNIAGKSCRDNQNTNFTFNELPEIRAVYKIIWKNVVQPNRPQMTIRRI